MPQRRSGSGIGLVLWFPFWYVVQIWTKEKFRYLGCVISILVRQRRIWMRNFYCLINILLLVNNKGTNLLYENESSHLTEKNRFHLLWLARDVSGKTFLKLNTTETMYISTILSDMALMLSCSLQYQKLRSPWNKFKVQQVKEFNNKIPYIAMCYNSTNQIIFWFNNPFFSSPKKSFSINYFY